MRTVKSAFQPFAITLSYSLCSVDVQTSCVIRAHFLNATQKGVFLPVLRLVLFVR